jgi:transcriptional regulator with GAF, ATPase, and Fis domain
VLECSIATSPKNFLALTPAVEAELRQSPAQQPPADPIQAAEPVDEGPSITKAEIEAALHQAGGSVTKAARRLGLKNRFALYRLMKRHDIARADTDEP